MSPVVTDLRSNAGKVFPGPMVGYISRRRPEFSIDSGPALGEPRKEIVVCKRMAGKMHRMKIATCNRPDVDPAGSEIIRATRNFLNARIPSSVSE